MNRANRPRMSRISGSSYASKLMGRAGDGSTLTLDFTAMGSTIDSRITFSRADATALATFVNSSGYVTTVATAQAPRFDFDPTTLAAKGLLLEAPATNLCLQSNTLNTTWTVANTNTPTVVSPLVNDPFGGTQTWKIVPTAGSGYHAVRQNFASLGTSTYTISCFVKAAQYDKFIISDLTNGVAAATFNLTAVTATPVAGGSTPTARITAYANGWYRCEMTVAFIYAGATGLSFSGYPTGATISAYGAQFNPNGTDGIYMAGAQVEISSASVPASSYIPTTTASVARAVDTAIMAGTNFSSWYTGDRIGTFVTEWFYGATTTTNNTVIATSDVARQHLHQYVAATTAKLRLANKVPVIIETANAASNNAFNEGAFSYQVSVAQSLCLNGGTVATGAFVHSENPTWLSIGGVSSNGTSITDTTTMLNNSIRKIKYFPTRLSNAQLQALTAL